MTSTIIRNTLTSIILLMALVILTASTASASEITGALNSSGSTPTPSEKSAPMLRESVTTSSSGKIKESGDSSTSGYVPTAANGPSAQVAPQASGEGTIISSYTDTPNTRVPNSFAEYALPQEDSGNTAADTPLIAAAAVASTTAIFGWWWVVFSLFVISVLAGLYIYRPRHNDKRWIRTQY